MYIPSYSEFFAKTAEYQRAFNMERVNSYRGANPLALLIQKAPHIDPAVLTLAPIEVDRLLTREKLATWRSWQEEVP